MQHLVLPLAFVGSLAVFVAWLTVMLRHERARRVALVTTSQERSLAYCLHAQAAQRASVAPRPDLAPSPATAITSVSVVRAGSFCRVPGNVGRTKKGVVLVCEPSASGRPRWRRAEALKIAS
jgi:hypothetical protein